MRTPPPDVAVKLTEAAERVLRRHGVPRVDDVAAETGVPRATLYYYFAGRDDLLTFLLDAELRSATAALERAMGEHQDPRARLRAAIATLVRLSAERPELCLGLLRTLGREPALRGHLTGAPGTALYPVRQLLERPPGGRPVPSGIVDAQVAALMGAVTVATLVNDDVEAVTQALSDGFLVGWARNPTDD